MPNRVDVPDADRRAVKALCERIGVSRAAARLGMGKDSLLRIISRMPIRHGTLLVLRERLARVDANEREEAAAAKAARRARVDAGVLVPASENKVE